MTARRAKREKRTVQKTAAIRTSISFPSDVYDALVGIAREKKVSLAWVVREAAEQYIADRWPLLVGLKDE